MGTWGSGFDLRYPAGRGPTSAAKAELGTLYHNCQTGIIFCLTLADMGHPQPQTPVHCNNATTVGIANNTIKCQRSPSMEMRFFWIGDKVAQEMYSLQWHPGQEILADYQSKHHVGLHHVWVRPWYIHLENSPGYYLRRRGLAHWKGVLEPSKTGTYTKYPHRRLHGYSPLVTWITHLIPVT